MLFLWAHHTIWSKIEENPSVSHDHRRKTNVPFSPLQWSKESWRPIFKDQKMHMTNKNCFERLYPWLFFRKTNIFERPFLVNGKVDSWSNIQLLSERCHNTRWPVGWQATRGWERKEWFFGIVLHLGYRISYWTIQKTSELNFCWSSFTSSLETMIKNPKTGSFSVRKSSESRLSLRYGISEGMTVFHPRHR